MLSLVRSRCELMVENSIIMSMSSVTFSLEARASDAAESENFTSMVSISIMLFDWIQVCISLLADVGSIVSFYHLMDRVLACADHEVRPENTAPTM